MSRYEESVMNRKPRNHVVLAALKRRGGFGPHVKSMKSMRRAAKVSLQKGGECT